MTSLMCELETCNGARVWQPPKHRLKLKGCVIFLQCKHYFTDRNDDAFTHYGAMELSTISFV